MQAIVCVITCWKCLSKVKDYNYKVLKTTAVKQNTAFYHSYAGENVLYSPTNSETVMKAISFGSTLVDEAYLLSVPIYRNLRSSLRCLKGCEIRMYIREGGIVMSLSKLLNDNAR